MKVIVIGNRGVMGRRYMAILKYLGIDHAGFDIERDEFLIEDGTHFIIATPTDAHEEIICYLNTKRTATDILCEKPITKGNLEYLYALCEENWNNLYSVNQYQYLCKGIGAGPSFYDYFNHGKDGLYWDCFQIIALAKGKLTLNEDSPIWKCAINGLPLYPWLMDQAYISMVEDFLGPKKFMWSKEFALNATEKVRKLSEKY